MLTKYFGFFSTRDHKNFLWSQIAISPNLFWKMKKGHLFLSFFEKPTTFSKHEKVFVRSLSILIILLMIKYLLFD